jgi:hypothetical protein
VHTQDLDPDRSALVEADVLPAPRDTMAANPSGCALLVIRRRCVAAWCRSSAPCGSCRMTARCTAFRSSGGDPDIAIGK